LSTISFAILLIINSSVAFGVVDTSYEQIVLGEIENNRKIKLEEKKIEVLARLERMSAPQTYVNSVSHMSAYSYNKNSSRVDSTQKTKVS